MKVLPAWKAAVAFPVAGGTEEAVMKRPKPYLGAAVTFPAAPPTVGRPPAAPSTVGRPPAAPPTVGRPPAASPIKVFSFT